MFGKREIGRHLNLAHKSSLVAKGRLIQPDTGNCRIGHPDAVRKDQSLCDHSSSVFLGAIRQLKPDGPRFRLAIPTRPLLPDKCNYGLGLSAIGALAK